MKIMLGMLINLLDSLDQIVTVEAQSTIGVLKDLFTKLNGKEAETWWEMLKKFLRRETCWAMTVLQKLIASGKYDWVDSNITGENFPVPDNFVLGLDPKVFYYDRAMSSKEVEEDMAKVGYEPAMIWDLLDYGAKNTEEQREYPILGLGSVALVHGNNLIPCLHRGCSERGLGLYWFDGDWCADWRFLGVRKVSQTSVS